MSEVGDAPLRTYGGVPGADRRAERRARLVEAGLELLGTGRVAALTVRGVCRQAGLAPRYFYESFADRDALAVAVLDRVVTGLADTVLSAVREAPSHARVEAGVATIVAHVAADPRRGQLLFSPALSTSVLARRRVESTRLFARLLVDEATELYALPADADLELVTELLVGGLAQILAAWLDGELALSERELVARCVRLFATVGTHVGLPAPDRPSPAG